MIYFVRHGVTDWNENTDKNGKKNPKCQGRADIPLNDNGIKQAEKLRDMLKNIKFDKVFCSPLMRAKQTCEIIVGSLEDVIIDNRLIERDFGKYEGMTRDQFDFADFCKKNSKCSDDAETVQEVENRIFSFLNELRCKAYKNVLLVSHGGVGCVFRSYFDGVPEDGDYSNLLIPNGEPLIRDFN